MKKALVCALVMSVAALGQAKKTASGASTSPYVGTWKLDPSSQDPWGWKTATWTVSQDNEEKIAWSFHGVGNDGKPFHTPLDVAMKGKESRIGKGDMMLFNADHSFHTKFADGGSEELRLTVSEDHQTLKADGTSTDKDGKTEDVHDVWKRAGAIRAE